jgi:hypothetical protein
MEYHPATGFDTNKQHAVDIVKKLGRSWYGGEALLEKAPPVVPDIKHDDIIQQVPIDEVVIPAPATPPVVLPAQVEALNCRAFENAPDAGSAFKISCQNTSLKLSPGDSVPFNIQFNDGTAIQQNLKMGETLLKVPQDAYLESALTSSLNEAIKAHAAEAAPQLTVAR